MWFALASTTALNCSQPLPTVYSVTDHYLGYTAVLVRMSRVTPDVLRDLLGMAHKFVTADVAVLHRTADASLSDSGWLPSNPRATVLIAATESALAEWQRKHRRR